MSPKTVSTVSRMGSKRDCRDTLLVSVDELSGAIGGVNPTPVTAGVEAEGLCPVSTRLDASEPNDCFPGFEFALPPPGLGALVDLECLGSLGPAKCGSSVKRARQKK